MKSVFSVLLLCFVLVSCGEKKSVEAEEAVETEKSVEGVKIMQELAEQGDAEAQFNLGVMYANGEGVPQDYAEAVKWYPKAAEQGDEYAKEWLEKNAKDKSE